MTRAAIAQAVRDAGGNFNKPGVVRLFDEALDALGVPRDGAEGMRVNPKGLALMREFEGCRLDAYPDPGSRDGNPWTIGYGATGPGIHRGVRWTQQQCEERHEQDVARFAAGVEKLLAGSRTTSNQFSALVSLAYNIGLHALGRSTVLRKHKAGDYAGAANAFSMWNKNDGKAMAGLARRRAAEAALYGSET